MSEDSKAATLEHMRMVSFILNGVLRELLHRIEIHDEGKLQPEEKDIFDKYTPKLKGSEYGSDEYKGFLKGMKPALDHHYATNRHHPEFGEVNLEWKDIEGYEAHYQISNFGDVLSLDRVVARPNRGDSVTKKGQSIKGQVTARGYTRVQLTKDGVSKNYMVHRLVAITFLENPESKPEVNHLDGVKNNNHISNLVWATSSDNQKHAYDTGLKLPCYKYVVHCAEHDITTFGTVRMSELLAEKGVIVSAANIWRVMDGGGKAAGLHFEGSLIKEHYRSRIQSMNLVDLIEMICDWFAATKRHDTGDLMKSIRLNQDRFCYGDELKVIFENTARWLQGEELVYDNRVSLVTWKRITDSHWIAYLGKDTSRKLLKLEKGWCNSSGKLLSINFDKAKAILEESLVPEIRKPL